MAYFKKNNIQSIRLENNKLLIKYRGKAEEEEEEEEEPKTAELQLIKSFAEKIGKNSLSLQDLQQVHNTDNSNKGLYIGLTILSVVVLLLVGVIAYFLIRNNKKNK